MPLNHCAQSLPSKSLANCVDHSGDSHVLKVVVVPCHNTVLKFFQDSYSTVEHSHDTAIDGGSCNVVQVASRGDLLLQDFIVLLSNADLAHVEWVVVICVPVEVTDGKDELHG